MNAPTKIPVRDVYEHADALDDCGDLFRRDARRPGYCWAWAIRSEKPGKAPASDPPFYASKADAEADAENYRRQWRGRPGAPVYSVREVYTSVHGLLRGEVARPLFGQRGFARNGGVL